MNRRSFFRGLASGAASGFVLGGAGRLAGRAEEGKAAAPVAARSPIKIERVRAILTAPARIRLVAVKVETSEPGLYGLGCATFTQRARPVVEAVDRYLSPFLQGKDPANIEDLWQAMFVSSYWRNGPVLMCALGGVDMALWDICGKRAGLPVWALLGGKCRVAAPVYRHASGRTPAEVAEAAQAYLSQGYRHVRVQVAVPGNATYGGGGDSPAGEGHFAGSRFDPSAYRRAVPPLFEHLRKVLGDEVELLHDVHERLPPIQAVGLAKDLEKFRLFFLEDPLAPEDVNYLKTIRSQCSTPIAIGELFDNPAEWVDPVAGRLLDFIRCHLSMVGGITMGRKIAALCEFFGVRTAWHGPGDLTPIGQAANLHLDLASWNFGIQEHTPANDAVREVFPGTPEVKDGMLWANDRPGLGVDLDEAAAARYPIRDDPPFDLQWGRLRGRDGTLRRP